MKAKRTILIGWDAADWKVIDALIARGHMPTLANMVKKGVRGNLSTLKPVLSPMLWTSIATGKYAFKHGIYGFTEPDYELGIVRPITGSSRKARAIWNILTHQKLKTNVFAWWPSHPAEPVNGVYVSNMYQRASKPISEPWPMLPGTVHPPHISEGIADLRIHPDELTEAHILPFIPKAGKVDQENDRRIGALSKIIADASTVHAASTWAMEKTEWDFTAVYHDAIDHACHGFMKYRAPQLPGLPDDLFEIYQHVVDGMYRFHDMMLERTLKLVGPDTNVILISDHGFQSDHLRPLQLPKEPAGPAAEHRQHGIVVMMGPDFKENEIIYGSSLLDITPTILTLYGLPVGDDMDGTPLVQAFRETPKVSRIKSWEDVKGDFGTHPENIKTDLGDAKQAVQQLVDLGYIEDPGKDNAKAIERTEMELDYNLAQSYLSTGQSAKALPLLIKCKERKNDFRFNIRIADCQKRLGQHDECLKTLDQILEDFEKKEATVGLFRADVLISKGETQEALKVLTGLDKEVPNTAAILRQLGNCHIKLKEWKQAEKAYARALIVDPHDALSWAGTAQARLMQDLLEESIEASLQAIDLVYQMPKAHLLLGEALYKAGAYEMAAKSFEVSLAMKPSLTAAHRFLSKIYKEHNISKDQLFNDLDIAQTDATAFDSEVEQAQKKAAGAKSFKGRKLGEIIVVSGLPRSGTSMMMQMLAAGGVEIFTDEEREADENNPKGFYEHERVKNIHRDNSFLQQAKGKGVKIVAQLLKSLPQNFTYKVIMMNRNLDEVITSQHKMLVRAGKAKADVYPTKIANNFKLSYRNAKAWAVENPDVEILEMPYADVVANPEDAAQRISKFLGKKMDIEKMVAAVDPDLYRNKLKNKTEA